ncbi:MAG: hypothetical protein R2710_11825 [Acidimicrobiales bacterium]
MSISQPPLLPEGLVAFVKRDCPTCELVIPALTQLDTGPGVTVITQDDPAFPAGLDPIDDAIDAVVASTRRGRPH